jgi:hypothetical protein
MQTASSLGERRFSQPGECLLGSSVGNLRLRRFPTPYTGCNLCKPLATHVHVGFSQSRACESDRDVAVLGVEDAESLAGLVQDALHGERVRERHDRALSPARA